MSCAKASTSRKNIGRAALLLAGLIALPINAQGQELDRGHAILLARGLQIQAQAFPVLEDTHQVVGFDLNRWAQSNFTTVNFQWNNQAVQYLGAAPGIQWGRYTGGTFLTSEELPYLPNMVSFQFGDEQDLSTPQAIETARGALEIYRSAYPDALSFTNQWGSQLSLAQLKNYASIARPDMVIFDTYPFNGNASGANRSKTAFYEDMQKYRVVGLGGHDGAGNQPIPYGLYTQAFTAPWLAHAVSDSEIRLNQFSAWAFGYTFVSAYTYTSPHANDQQSVLFNGAGDGSPTARFTAMAETNRQSRNLGPALVRLLSTDIRMVRGQYRIGANGTATNALPSGISEWNNSAGPYITGIAVTNVGNRNDGRRGDVWVGYFKPLLESFDGDSYTNETYFMIVNGLVDPAMNADVRQSIRLTFDFGSSGIDSLQRLNRDTGLVELIPLISDGGSFYHYDLLLDGGSGDLFKFNTGAPFIVPEPATMSMIGAGILTALLCRNR